MKWALLGAVAAIGVYILWQKRANAGPTVAYSGGNPQVYGRSPAMANVGNSGLPPRTLGTSETYTPAPSQRPSVGSTVGCAGGAVGGAGAAMYFGQPQFAPLAGTIGCTIGGKIGGIAGTVGSKIGSGTSTALKKLKFW